MSVNIEKIRTAGMSLAAWLEARRHSIGGSDAAAVMGLNPYKSPFSLWAEKTGMAPEPDISEKESVRLGNYLEPYVAQRFSEITGKKVRRENAILKNPDYPWAHANVDRMVIGEKAGLECKTTSELNLRRFRNGEYPANYYCQCVHYLAVTGYDKWYLAVLIGNRELRIFEIDRDEEEIRALMESEKRFWELVERRVPPEADGSPATSEALDTLYPGGGGEMDLTPVSRDIRDYLAIKTQIKALEDQLGARENTIKAYMADATRGAAGDMTVIWAPFQTRRFDKEAFLRDNPGFDLEKYSRVTTGRRFTVKG